MVSRHPGRGPGAWVRTPPPLALVSAAARSPIIAGEDLPAGLGGQAGQDPNVRAVFHEGHRAIGEQEVGSAWVKAQGRLVVGEVRETGRGTSRRGTSVGSDGYLA